MRQPGASDGHEKVAVIGLGYVGLPVAVEPEQEDLARRRHVELRVAGGAEYGVLGSRREARQSGAPSGVAIDDPETRHGYSR